MNLMTIGGGGGLCGGEDDVFVFSGFSFSASVCVQFSIFRFLLSFHST
jgi:hypothetical protein